MNVSYNKLIWFGRYLDNKNIRYFNYSASGFCFVFKGKHAELTLTSDAGSWKNSEHAVVGIYISSGEDISWNSFPEKPNFCCTLKDAQNTIPIFDSTETKTVCIRVIKLSEVGFGYAGFKNLKIDGKLIKSTKLLKKYKINKLPKIEFIGDSITCGYGIDGVWNKDTFTTQQERADKSYAFLTAKKLNASFLNCCWSGIGIISDYVDPPTAVIPETKLLMPELWPYTDKYLCERLNIEPPIWNSKIFSPDIIVINLGTNDTSWVQNHEDRKVTFTSCYKQFLEKVHQRSPNAKICCCLGVMGAELFSCIEKAICEFSKTFPSVTIKTVQFPLQQESDGIATDWHPSFTTHQKIANILVQSLKELI